MHSSFKKFNKKNPFIFDGAFGTYYFSQYGYEEFCENANINDEESVKKIHLDYIKSGVNGIKTNTFGANLLNYPDESTRNKIIQKGYAIAVESSRTHQTEVFADIGYIDIDHESVSEKFKPENEYISIAEEFIKAGATNFIFETFPEFDVIIPAIEHIKKTSPNSFVIVCFAVSQDGFTKKGHHYKTLLKNADESMFTDVVGLNCVCGPAHLSDLILKAGSFKKALCAMPNSGYPATINSRMVYTDNSEYFADIITKINSHGVCFVGGCCGTTPLHILSTVKRIRQFSNIESKDKMTGNTYNTVFSEEKVNSIVKKFESKGKILAIEIDPPKDTEMSFIIEAARRARDLGVDLITVADSPLARARADSFVIASKIKRELSIETMPHLACRDKNHIAVKASVLAGYIENIFNL